MSSKALGWAWEQDIPASEKYVLLALADCAGWDNDQAFPGQLTLALKTGLAERTVRKALKSLQARGLIVRMPRFRFNGTRTSDLITLMTPPAIHAGSRRRRPPASGADTTGTTYRAITNKGNLSYQRDTVYDETVEAILANSEPAEKRSRSPAGRRGRSTH